MYQEEKGYVIVMMTEEEWATLVMLMGVASSIPGMLPVAIRLLNSLNVGNPRYVPYEVPDQR
jgi:hypothetical protein